MYIYIWKHTLCSVRGLQGLLWVECVMLGDFGGL